MGPGELIGDLDFIASDPVIEMVIRNAPVVLFATDQQGVMVMSRGKALDAMGLAQNELVGKSVFDLYVNEPAVADASRRALSGEQVTVQLDLDGIVHETMFAPMRGSNGVVTGLVGVGSDITERVRAEEQLRRELQFDASTGLPNRRHFEQRVQHAIDEAMPQHQSVAVIAIRLSQYRDVSEALGFDHAEMGIREAAHRLGTIAPVGATVGRIDAGRFAMLLPIGVTPGAATMTAARVVEVLRAPYELGGRYVDMQPVAGLALHPGHASVGEVLVRRAEATLSMAAHTVDGYAVYSSTRHAAQAENLSLLGDLQRALHNGEIDLHYQPLATMGDGEVRCVEALARWNHPELGPISPERFVALAESSGLIRPLTSYVLDRAARQIHMWQAEGLNLRVDVNVSPRDVLDRQFVSDIDSALGSWGVSPDRLAIEITERAVVEDARTTRERLGQIDSMGMHISIDDFGTGYSNLTSLKQLPFHSIKIDRSFVSGLPTDPQDQAIVASVVQLANAMGRETTAEGVETSDVWDKLSEMGCSDAQGYLIAKPMPATDLAAWLRAGQWNSVSAA